MCRGLTLVLHFSIWSDPSTTPCISSSPFSYSQSLSPLWCVFALPSHAVLWPSVYFFPPLFREFLGFFLLKKKFFHQSCLRRALPSLSKALAVPRVWWQTWDSDVMLFWGPQGSMDSKQGSNFEMWNFFPLSANPSLFKKKKKKKSATLPHCLILRFFFEGKPSVNAIFCWGFFPQNSFFWRITAHLWSKAKFWHFRIFAMFVSFCVFAEISE